MVPCILIFNLSIAKYTSSAKLARSSQTVKAHKKARILVKLNDNRVQKVDPQVALEKKAKGDFGILSP